jgi:hypothetical protein
MNPDFEQKLLALLERIAVALEQGTSQRQPTASAVSTGSNSDWRSVVCPVGKNKGMPLGKMRDFGRWWWDQGFTGNPKYPDSMEFAAALDKAASELGWPPKGSKPGGRPPPLESKADRPLDDGDVHIPDDDIPF